VKRERIMDKGERIKVKESATDAAKVRREKIVKSDM